MILLYGMVHYGTRTSRYALDFWQKKFNEGEALLFLFVLKYFAWEECRKRGKSRSLDPLLPSPPPPPIHRGMPGLSGCSLNFGRKGQCDALWDLPKIITNTQD